jgi:predicted acetyltransferase
MPERSGPGPVPRAVDVDSPDLRAWVDTARLVFKDASPDSPERLDNRREVYRQQRLSGVFDGEIAAGTFRSWDTRLTVPGGTVPADAISSVTVRPTHRRRGTLRAMLAADLERAVAAGTPVAVLVASEAPIYGRFGFGPATEHATWTLDVGQARVRPDVAPGVDVEVVPEAALRGTAPGVYEGSRRVGDIDRSAHWWELALGLRQARGESRTERTAVVARDGDGAPTGYLRYTAEPSYQDRVTRTVVDVEELVARDAGGYVALWQYLAGLDLVRTVTATDRATDEALPWLLVDPRAARMTSRADFLWTRVLDPAAVLSARTYERPGAVTMRIVDPDGWADGTWQLEAASDGTGSCTPAAGRPDLTVPVEVLGAGWLAGAGLDGAAVAGRLTEHRAGSLRHLAAMLTPTRAAWSSTWF